MTMNQYRDEQQTMVLGGATFLIRVQYRQNASWQGTIQWLDEKITIPFRSSLELMMLIERALDKAGVSGTATPRGCWQEKESTG